MDGALTVQHAFLATGLGRGGLALRAIRQFPGGQALLLHCRGIQVGQLRLRRAVAAGEVVEIPVARLPRVPLPAELRLSAALDGPDLATPWRIETAEVAPAILGAPDIRVEDLHLDHGVLRGTGRETRNGLIEPVLFARINDSRARIVTVEPPVGLPEGGCAFRFALPLQPADMTSAGLSVQLYLVGQDTPVASFAWTAQGAGEAEQRVVALEARLRQVEEESSATQQTLQAALRQQLSLQQERIDAFIAAASTLLLDRLAAEPGREQDALRALLETAGPGLGAAVDLDLSAQRIEVPPEAGIFGTGWHREEIYGAEAFRWMSGRGLLLNPAPERPVAAVTLQVCHLYRAAAPALSARFEEAAAEVAVAPTPGGGHSIRLAPVGDPRPARLLRLQSLTGGSPAEDGVSTDRRMLSFAVSRVVFDYAD
ncbi:hypothetical protein [Roseicella aquatilis]|nr:hypothetical protein [Roseicella aquatilis]